VQYVLIVVVLAAVAWFVTAPLRRPRQTEPEDPAPARVRELEIRKESKYREIRDAQLDHAAGKLSDADFEKLDADLRNEAAAILRELDRAAAEARRPPA
jgi:flagellar biosynthesis/type III secretory pathway M-ring protein FliF/YscJ